MEVAGLVLLAVALAWPVPRLMARMTVFRHRPRPALVVWQATAVAAVLAALLAAPAAVPGLAEPERPLASNVALLTGAAAVSAVVLARLLVSGHRVGTRLRALRRRHRELVDLLASATDGSVRVLEHRTPTAYCLPGLQRRVVLTQGTLDTLAADEVAAVLAHERAHLSARHDLVLEFFTVVHRAVPAPVRSAAALREVHLLIEVLADRSAVRAAGLVPTARAIVAMATGPGNRGPAGSLGMTDATGAARLRVELLTATETAGPADRLSGALMYGFAVALVSLPVALAVVALTPAR